jgi:hypothetical protein
LAASSTLGRQFDADPPGDDAAKRKLRKQLKPDFPKAALAWLDDPKVTVEAPSKVSPEDVNWSDYPDWRASRQLKTVVKIAKKKISKGKGRASVMAARPGNDKLDVIEGHHHALARLEAQKKPLTYVVHVPSATGAWDTMHDHQKHDKIKDDFGKTDSSDRSD